MPKLIDLSGQRFGRLRVISRHSENTKLNRAHWNCICDCGEAVIIAGNSLSAGRTRSCGCLNRETITKHGYSHLTEFQIWRQMKERCYNTKAPNYENYGGRGITMCDEWKESFEAFYRDMGPRHSPDHTIDRRENDKDYSKDNCRWATPIEQLNNKRNNHYCEYKGEIKTLSEWCNLLNLKYPVIEQRLRVAGMNVEKAFEQSLQQRVLYTHNGKTANLGQWCRELRLNYATIDRRIRILGMSFETAISFVPSNSDTYFTIGGVTKSLKKWCKERNIKISTVINRLYKSWSFEESLQSIEKREIIFENEINTLEFWCDLFDLDKNQTYLRILRGENFEDIVKE